MPRRSFLLSAVCILGAAAVVASGSSSGRESVWWTLEISPDCDDGSTFGLTQCAQRSVKAAEREMNEALKQTETALRKSLVQEDFVEDVPEVLRLLRQSQKAWKLFRDANCASVATVHFAPSGTFYGVADGECLAFMTRRRTMQLREEFLRPLQPVK